MAYKDLGNGIQFDPETGQMQIIDQTGASQWAYDPRHGANGGTQLGNQWYNGELNPNVLAKMTDQQYTDAAGKYQTAGDLGIDTTDPKMNNAFGNNLGDYSNEQNNYMNQWSQLAGMKTTQDAYNTQAATM